MDGYILRKDGEDSGQMLKHKIEAVLSINKCKSFMLICVMDDGKSHSVGAIGGGDEVRLTGALATSSIMLMRELMKMEDENEDKE